MFSSSVAPAEIKNQLRIDALKRRDAIPAPVRNVKDSAIRHRLVELPEYIGSKVLLFYASFRSEADTSELIGISLSSGKRVMLPKVQDDRLGIYEIKSADELSPGYMGIPEPPETLKGAIDDIDLIILPGVAFDERCNRLGYGKGYYDRLLGEIAQPIKPALISIAYEEQVINEIPVEPHDVGLDMIITDRRTIKRHGQGKD